PSYSIVLYEWDFDGDLVYDATGQSLMHSYSEFDSYTVTLRVTDDNDPAQTDAASAVIDVDQGNMSPSADTGGPYVMDVGDGLTLDASGSTEPNVDCGDSIVLYEWDLDYDSIYEYSGSDPTLELTWTEVASSGLSYPSVANTIFLRVTDSFDTSSTASTTVTIYYNEPVASFTANPNPAGCTQDIFFDASSSYHRHPSQAIVLCEWDFDGDLVYDATGQSLMHSYSTFDSYTVTLRVTDDNVPAKTDTTSLVIDVDQGNMSPSADTGGPYVMDVGGGLTLDASGSFDPNVDCGDSIVLYEWDLDYDSIFDATGSEPTLELTWADCMSYGLSYPGAANTIILRVSDSFDTQSMALTTITIVYPGDFDDDGDVELDDYDVFAACLAGPNVSTPPGGCTLAEYLRADMDRDRDADAADFAGFQLVFTGPPGPVTLYPTDDALIDQYNPGGNSGATSTMGTRNQGSSAAWEADALVQFDLSSIPPETTITSATLHLYYFLYWDNNPSGRALSCHRITSAWDEGTVTWNTSPSHAASVTASSTVPATTGQWMTWDVTTDVQLFLDEQATNHGWIIMDEVLWTGGGIPFSWFRTKEYGDFIPYLVID
ncbi:MAG: DNRLRE domain-containing protein, partial [Planctomycetota bacterium]